MKLEITQNVFMKYWSMAERCTGTKSTMATLASILCTADEDSVTLHATDLKTTIRVKAEGAAVIEPGTAILPLKVVGELFKKISVSPFTVEVRTKKDRSKPDATATRSLPIPSATSRSFLRRALLKSLPAFPPATWAVSLLKAASPARRTRIFPSTFQAGCCRSAKASCVSSLPTAAASRFPKRPRSRRVRTRTKSRARCFCR